MTNLSIGQFAPRFSGINQNGELISSSDFQGKKLILFFYPKDNTSACTAESCNLNENYDMWREKGYVVIGVSPDSVASHKKFSDKYNFAFNIIADTELEIINKYEVWGEKSMYGKKYMGVFRTTFVINENRIIESVITKVETKKHSEQLIKVLDIK